MTILIIGAGLTGLSASFFLRRNHVIVEKENFIGGLCNTAHIKGFYFDYTAHLIHFKTSFCLKLLNKQLAGNINHLKRKAYIFLKDQYIKYPFQINFKNLPSKIVKECVFGFIRAFYNPDEPDNFLEWILQHYGEGMAEHFFIPYNEKQWKFPLEEMDYKILTKYIPKITLSDLFYTLLNFGGDNHGYNVNFYYPKQGGIKSFAQTFLKNDSLLKLNHKLIKINFKQKMVTLKNIKNQQEYQIKYDNLISTIPLPELLKIIEDIPVDLLKDLENFYFTSILCLNYGTKNPNITNKHWIYFPEKKYIFHRISFPSNFSPNMVPKSNGSLSVEISYNSASNFDLNEVSEQVISKMIDLGFIKNRNDIIVRYPMQIPFGYVIYKKGIAYDLWFERIHTFLKQNNIYSIGRFGNWIYSNMEDAIIEGKTTAEYFNSI